MDVQRFFEVALPQMLTKHWDVFVSTRGSVAFSVQDAGSWTLLWGETEEPVVSGFLPDASLKVWFSAPMFQAFLEGRLDPDEAVERGEIVCEGEEDLFETLGYFLRPSNSVFDVYLQG